MTTRLRVAARAAVAAACLAASAPGHALDLMDAWRSAQGTDPAWGAAQEALAAGREKALQGRALLRPQVGLSASATQMRERSSLNLPPQLAGLVPAESSGATHQVAIQLVQPIYAPQARAEQAQLEQQAARAEVQHRQAGQELAQRVAEAYLAVLLAGEQLDVVRAERAAVTQQRDRAQARYDVGRGKITELQETQARLDHVAAREVSAASTLSLRQAQFTALTGAAAQGLSPLADGGAPELPQPADLASWQAQADGANLQVMGREIEQAIAQAEVEKQRRSARPTLDLVASVAHRGLPGGSAYGLESQRSASVGIQFSMPLYAGGALDSREREAQARARQSTLDLATARRDARLRVQDSYLAATTGVARVAAQRQSLASTRTALEATTLGRDLGTRTELDVLDAQQRVYGAQLDLLQARHEQLLARVRLAAAAGSLGEAELQALNRALAR